MVWALRLEKIYFIAEGAVSWDSEKINKIMLKNGTK